MKTFTCSLLILSLAANWPARAVITGGEAALITGAAAAASLLVPATAQALTKSEVHVDVEVFRETIPLSQPTNMTMQLWMTLSPEQRRSDPFKLGGETALQRMMHDGAASDAMTPAKALLVADNLSVSQGEFERMIGQLKSALLRFDGWIKTAGIGAKLDGIQAVTNDFTRRLAAATVAMQAIKDFRDSVRTNHPVNVALSSNLLETVRKDLHEFPRGYPQEAIELFHVWVRPLFRGSIAGASRGTNILALDDSNAGKKNVKNIKEAINACFEGTPGAAPDHQMAHDLAESLRLLREMDANDGMAVVAGYKISFQTEDLRKDVDELLSAFGFLATSKQLQSIEGEGAFLTVWTDVFLPKNTEARADDALRLSFVGVSSGANFGPIANEAFQGIFARSKLIDTIVGKDSMSDPNRWTRFNYAESISHAGDHNAIIYLDNTLTPMLKNASFDPSQFIAANAQLYKRAASVMTEVFGLPISGQSGAGTASSSRGLNLYEVKARKKNADDAVSAQRALLRETLQALIDLNRATQSDISVAGAWNSADAGTNQVKAVRQKLEALSIELQTKIK